MQGDSSAPPSYASIMAAPTNMPVGTTGSTTGSISVPVAVPISVPVGVPVAVPVTAGVAVPQQQPAFSPLVNFNLMWTEKGSHSEDVDLFAIMYDANGRFLGRVGFDQTNLSNAVMHSGDQKDGKGQGIDEQIVVNYNNMPPNVFYVVFVVCINNQDAQNCDLFTECRMFCTPVPFEFNFLNPMFGNMKTFIPCVASRVSVNNSFTLSYPPPGYGMSPFVGLPACWTICDRVLDLVIDPRVRARTDPLSLKLKDKVILPHPDQHICGTVGGHSKPLKTFVGLGWEPSRKGIDLDARCIVVYRHSSSNASEHIYFNNKTGCGGAIQHMGDNRTGAGKGDDERIMVDLARIDPNVHRLIFAVTIYTDNVTFREVEGEFVRVVYGGDEVAKYQLDDVDRDVKRKIDGCNAAVFCVLEQEKVGRHYQWHFKAMLEGVRKEHIVQEAIKVAHHH